MHWADFWEIALQGNALQEGGAVETSLISAVYLFCLKTLNVESVLCFLMLFCLYSMYISGVDLCWSLLTVVY